MDSSSANSSGDANTSARQPRFSVTRLLGQGAQGFVQAAIDNANGQPVAIKYLKRGWSSPFYKYILREILNHQQLSVCKHPHVVEFYEVFLTPKYLGIVMEFVDGTDLHHYLQRAGGRLPEDTARFVFQQLMIAVDFCHRMGKVNRDIKLANILVKEGKPPLVKLCDFGFSKDKDDSEPQTQLGTALFTAPEVIMNVPGRSYDAEAADLWSCGIVLYALAFGGHPFLTTSECQRTDNNFIMQLVDNCIKGRMNMPTNLSEAMPLAEDLLRKMLVADPGQRIKMAGVFAHPWFKHNLPPGALLLNDVYLSMGHVNSSSMRQSPDAIVRTVMAAATITTPTPAPGEAQGAGGSGAGGAGPSQIGGAGGTVVVATPTMLSVNTAALSVNSAADMQRQTSESIVKSVMAALNTPPGSQVMPLAGPGTGLVAPGSMGAMQIAPGSNQGADCGAGSAS